MIPDGLAAKKHRKRKKDPGIRPSTVAKAMVDTSDFLAF